MVNEGRARLFRRKDGKYLIYVPKALVEDSMFPFKEWEQNPRKDGASSVRLNVSFKIGGDKLLIEKWREEEETE